MTSQCICISVNSQRVGQTPEVLPWYNWAETADYYRENAEFIRNRETERVLKRQREPKRLGDAERQREKCD